MKTKKLKEYLLSRVTEINNKYHEKNLTNETINYLSGSMYEIDNLLDYLNSPELLSTKKLKKYKEFLEVTYYYVYNDSNEYKSANVSVEISIEDFLTYLVFQITTYSTDDLYNLYDNYLRGIVISKVSQANRDYTNYQYKTKDTFIKTLLEYKNRMENK